MTTGKGVLVVGSANLDIVVTVPRVPSFGETILGSDLNYLPGGKGLNQVCAAARTGVDAAFVGALGNDDAGKQLLDAMNFHGVDTTSVETIEGEASGTAHILVSTDGGNQIVVVPSANSMITPAAVDEAFASHPQASVLVTQGEIPVAAAARAAENIVSRGGRFVFNVAPADLKFAELFSLADPLVVNEYEAGILLDAPAPDSVEAAISAAKQLATIARSAIVTLGGQGLVVADQQGCEYIAASKVDKVVDTTGAGDAFVGVLAAELSCGVALIDAARTANAAAGQTVTKHGASQSYVAIPKLHDD